MNRLSWLDREPFFAIVDARPVTREWQYISFNINHDSICSDIPAPCTENPDDETFPSSVRRWYGQIDDRFFVLDIFYNFHPDQCHVRIPYSESHEFAWQTLLDLQLLPSSVHTNQTIGISNDSDSRTHSVFRPDPRGFCYPIYDGTSEDDASSLIDFLRIQDPSVDYSLGLPEPDINWVAKELVGDSQVHRARYNSRTSAISVACGMSQKSDNDFAVYSESPSLDGRQYLVCNGTFTHAG